METKIITIIFLEIRHCIQKTRGDSLSIHICVCVCECMCVCIYIQRKPKLLEIKNIIPEKKNPIDGLESNLLQSRERNENKRKDGKVRSTKCNIRF